MNELRELFGTYIEKKSVPKRNDCRAAIARSKATGGILQRRTPELIIKKISYMNHQS